MGFLLLTAWLSCCCLVLDIRGNNYTRGKKHVLAPVLVRASKYSMNHNAILTTKQLSESSRPDLQHSKVLETKKQKDKNKKAKKKEWSYLFTDVPKVHHRLDYLVLNRKLIFWADFRHQTISPSNYSYVLQ